MSLRFLTKDFPLEDYYFYLPRVCLRLMGVWPHERRTLRNTSLAFVNFFILFIGVSTELLAGIVYIKTDLELGLDTLCPAGTSFVCLLKMFFISYYQPRLRAILQQMRQMLYERNMGIEKENILRKHLMLAARLNFCPFIMGFITACTYNLKPVFLASWMWSQGREVIWKMPFNMMLPSSFFNWPFLPLTCIFIVYTSYQTIFLFGGADALYFEFCANITALLKLLQEDIRQIFHPYNDHLVLNEMENKLIEQQLVKIVDRHNTIIKLCHNFRDCYTVITLAHFVTAALVIGASIFDMLTFSGFGFIIYINYTLAAVMQLFIFCYGGTMVAESSERVSVVLFQSHWYTCNPKLRRMVAMIMIRSQQPITMSVPFFSPSLATLSLILKTSGSFMALASSFRQSDNQ